MQMRLRPRLRIVHEIPSARMSIKSQMRSLREKLQNTCKRPYAGNHCMAQCTHSKELASCKQLRSLQVTQCWGPMLKLTQEGAHCPASVSNQEIQHGSPAYKLLQRPQECLQRICRNLYICAKNACADTDVHACIMPCRCHAHAE